MSKLDELIEKLCPNGVEWKTLEELGAFLGGLTGKSKDDFKDGNANFITYMNVFSNPGLNLHDDAKVKIADGEKQRRLEYGDIIFTGSSEIAEECAYTSVVCEVPEEDYYLNSFCFILRLYNVNLFNPHFLKHLFRSSHLRNQLAKTANGVTRFNVSKEKMKKVKIPVPPLEVQCEIVHILDQFTLLTAELTAELTARRKQYKYYLDALFEQCNGIKKRLDGIGTFTRGKRFVHADAVSEDGIPCVHYGELYTYYGVIANKSKSQIRKSILKEKTLRYANKGDVIIVGAGENDEDIGIGVAWDGDYKVAVHDACYTFVSEQNPKFISYYLRSSLYHKQIKPYVSRGKICAISSQGIGKAIIKIPSLEEQGRIVSILENFDAYCNDLSQGLPAEIELRKKQYEYYRDKLLSFKELK